MTDASPVYGTMNADVYQVAIRQFARQSMDELLASLTIDKLCMLNYATGIAGEGGEVNDEIKKYVFHDKPLDLEKLIKECGDVIWYIARLMDLLQVPLSHVMRANYEKLAMRYPNGFDQAEVKFGFNERGE